MKICKSTYCHRGAYAFWLVISLLVAPPLTAQSGGVIGIVTDSLEEPLPGVNVVVEGTGVGTSTDTDGRFRIENLTEGTYIVRFSSIGFQTHLETVQIVTGQTIELSVRLLDRVLEAREVIVTASRREQAALTAPVSVSILSTEDLNVRNIVHLDDALRTVSGVHLQGNQVSVRGSSGFAYNTGSRVLLLLDGMSLLTPESDGIPFDALPFAQIERVEVLKGPGSSLYGSCALGGVINVITKDFPSTPETSLRTYAGAYEKVRYRIWRDAWKGANEVRGFGGLLFSHARKTSDRFGYWVNIAYHRDQGYLNFNETRTFHGYVKLGWRPSPQDRLNILVGLMAREKDSFLFWNGARDALNPGSLDIGGASGSADPSDTPTGTNDNLTNQISLLPMFTHLISDKMFYSIRARLFGLVIQPIDNDTGKPKPVSKGTLGFRYGAEVQLNWEERAGRLFTFGATGDALATRSSFFVTNNEDEFGSQPETAIFTQWEEELSDKLQLVAGFRFDRYQIDGTQSESKLSPKISAAYLLNDEITVRAAFGEGFRVPSFAERFTDNRDFFPIVRNLGLKPERSRSYEIGIKGRMPHPSAGLFRADVAVFWNEYWNLIEPKLVTSLQAFQFVNLTRARIRGGEASLEWELSQQNLKFRAGYTYLDADDLDENVALAFRSKHLIVLSIDSHVFGPWALGADFRFVSKPERLDTDFSRFIADADVLVNTRVIDVRASVNLGRLRAAILVNNLTQYYYLERPALLGAPRRATLQFQYDF